MMKMKKNIIFSSDKKCLTDRAFKQSMTISVVGIILCMIALCSATWAWFITGVSSPANNIRPAHCDFDVTVFIADGSSMVLPENGTYSLQKNTAYTFTITAGGTAENAYCILNIDGSEYYTDQFDMVNNNGTLTGVFSFSLYFKDTDITSVEIITRWGKSGAAATFRNNEKYLDLKKVEEFPISVPEVTTPAGSTTAEPNNAETTAMTEPEITSEITE